VSSADEPRRGAQRPDTDGAAAGALDDPGAVGLVDWGRTGRRVRTSVLVLAAAVLAAWTVLALLGDGFDLRTLGGLLGLALALLFVVELVVVGGAALRGMLRAGERGERLASRGVGLLPPRMPDAAERAGRSRDGDGGAVDDPGTTDR
jgi:hypothetical protein